MILGFNNYLNEVIGANSMERDPADIILSPDIKRANQMSFYAGTSGTVPTFWNNSPFLTGSRITSAFGLNPKEVKRKNVLTYHDFIKTHKKFSK